MHITQIVRQEQVSDECIAVTVRCCQNPKTDSTVTIYGIAAMDHAAVEAEVEKHHDRVAAKCDGMKKASDHLATLMTKTKQHGAK